MTYLYAMNAYKGKTVWITGASSGIGEALAREFARQGANLILSARNAESLERVAADCGGTVHIVPLDLGNADALPAAVDKAIRMAGSIDILVNNGGISQRSLAKDTHLSVDRQLIEVNLLGTIALSKALLPHFLERGGGHYVVLSSLMGKFGAPLRSAYAAAKHGLHGFFDTLRAECWRENVKVTLVCPGYIQTNISINALTGDGSRQGTMDEATGKGMTPETLARKIISAVSRDKKEVYFGGFEVVAIYLKRFVPGLLYRIVQNAKTT